MNVYDGTGPHPATQTTIAPQVICPRCETVHIGSVRPPGWKMLMTAVGFQLSCPDCTATAQAADAAKRTRARKGGAA